MALAAAEWTDRHSRRIHADIRRGIGINILPAEYRPDIAAGVGGVSGAALCMNRCRRCDDR